MQFQLASRILEHAGMGHRVKYAPESEFEAIQFSRPNNAGLSVFKAHICTPALARIALAGNAAVIYCYRDIRDVAVSAMRKFDMTFDALIDAGWLDQAIADYYAWAKMPNVLVSRYEEMISNLGLEAGRIADFLGARVDAEALSILARQYDIPAQQKRIDALRLRHGQSISGNEIVFDEVELLHHNHIHKGEVNGWRHLLSPLQQRFLTVRYTQWLAALEYEIEYEHG